MLSNHVNIHPGNGLSFVGYESDNMALRTLRCDVFFHAGRRCRYAEDRSRRQDS
jgi:hypothetical protein